MWGTLVDTMRITGGNTKGTRIRTLAGRSTRPTTSMVKEAIFSLLEHATDRWDNVLDLYAGSGALGIEALSRGAEWGDFVDHKRSCCSIIRDNLKKTGNSTKANVYCCDARRAMSFLDKVYDVVFLDPPYADCTATDLLADLAKSRLLGKDTTLVLSHANRCTLQSHYDTLQLVRQRRYGDTYISIYQKVE